MAQPPPVIELELPSMRLDANAEGVSAWQTLLTPAPDAFGGIRSAAKARQASQMRRVEKNLALGNKVDEALRARKTYSEVRELVRKSGAVCKIHQKALAPELAANNNDDDEDVDINISYRAQANLEMYTSQNMKCRDDNKRHPLIVEAINKFWDVLPKTENNHLNKSIYKWFNRKLFFNLVPRATEEEFERTVHEDWKNDAVYSHVMTHRQFNHAIFNLADLWCETVDPNEYRDFLTRCRKIVEAPPAYKGRLDEEAGDNERGRRRSFMPSNGAAPDGRRATATPGTISPPPPGGVRVLRRKSSLESGPTDSPVQPPLPTLADPESLDSLKYSVEIIEDEIVDQKLLAWYAIIANLSDIHSSEVEEAEDAIGAALRDLQDRRFDCFEDDKDPSFAFEAELMNQAREEMAARMEKRARIVEEQQQLQQDQQDPSKIGSNMVKWQKKRNQREGASLEMQEEHLNDIRASMQNNFSRFKNAYEEMYSMENGLVKHQKEKLHGNFFILLLQLDARAKQAKRAFDARADADEDAFQEFINISSDMHSFRKIADKATVDCLMNAVYEEFFTSNDPTISDCREVKFGGRRFGNGVDWFQRFCDARSDMLADAVETTSEAINRLVTRETKYLHQLHRLEMELETALIDGYVNDDVTPSAFKIQKMELLQEQKKAGVARRAAEMEQQGKVHQQWRDEFGALTAALEEQKEVENACLKQLRGKKNLEDAWEACGEMMQAYRSADSAQQLLEAASVLGKPALLDSKEEEKLPEEVVTPIDFFEYLQDRATNALHHRLALITGCRQQCYKARYDYYNDKERELAEREMHQYSDSLSDALQLLDGFKDAMGDPTKSAAYTESMLVTINDMLPFEGELKKQLTELKNNQAFREDYFDRIHKITSRRNDQRAQRFLTLFLMEHTELMRFLDLLRSKNTTQQNVMSRFSEQWSEVERAAKQAENTAADRRKKEAERIRKEQAAQEKRRKEAEDERLKRMLQDEKDRQELEKQRRLREKAISEKRKAQLEERERRQKEKLQKEAEAKKKWRQEYLEEQQARKKEASERNALQLQRAERAKKRHGDDYESPVQKPISPRAAAGKLALPGGGGNTVKGSGAGTAKGPSTGRKLSRINQYNPNAAADAKTSKAMLGNNKKVKTATAPSQRIKQAIEEEIKAFGTLNTTSMMVNMESFADRRTDYFVERASNAAIYAMECARLRCPISPSVSTLLSNEELHFMMTSFDISGKPVNILSILDLLQLNPVQILKLKKVKGVDKDSTKKLCQALMGDEFIQVIDLQNNPDIGPHGGMSILALVEANHRVVKVKLDGSNVPADTVAKINKLCEDHNFSSTIGRAEFNFIYDVFKAIDSDGSGHVDMSELRAYNKKHSDLLGTKSQMFEASGEGSDLNVTSPNKSTMMSMQERQTSRVDKVRDVLLTLEDEGTGSFTLLDLMALIFPTWQREDLDRLVGEYTDDSATGASLDEMQQFIDQFGTNGTITLHQLAKGLGESDVESLRAAFQECDLDGDGVLSIDEFMSFVGA